MVVLAVASILLVHYLSTNVTFLLMLAGGSDIPSHTYYWALHRIYEQCHNPSVRSALVEDLVSGRNRHLVDTYISILGVIGNRDASSPIVSELISAIDKKQYSTILNSINSLGLIGNEKSETYLKTLCDHYDSYTLEVSQSTLSRAMYLISGNINDCQHSDINRRFNEFIISDELVHAREIIVSSRDRYRTTDEMISLDKLLRPPNWK